MADVALACVGLNEDASLPDSVQSLVDTGLFGEPIRIAEAPDAVDQYWCHVIKHLPEWVDRVLVVDIHAEVTDDVLRLAPLLQDRTVAVMPLSLRHDIARPLMKPGESMSLSARDVNYWLNRYAVGKPLEIPLLAGFCGWVSASAIRNVGAGQDAELAGLLRQQGKSILLSDEAFVDDAACRTPKTNLKSLPEPIANSLLERHPYTALRHPLSQLNEQGQTPPAILTRGPGVILHISHSWGGGLARWISDFCAADEDRVHLILKSIGTLDAGAQAFSLHLGAAPVPLKQWSLTTPIQSTSLGNYEYRRILDEIRESFSIQGVVISTLIGHSLDLYDLPMPVVQVLHDYYPWCPPLYATWEKPCSSCDGTRLANCLKQNPAHRFFGEERSDWYLRLRDQFTEKVIARGLPVVAPSQSVKARWQQLAPPLASYSVSVIGHGLPARELESFEAHRWHAAKEGKLHLLVLGVLSDHKGGKTLKRLMPELLRRYRVTLLGTGEEAPSFDKHPDLTVVKWYQLPDLPKNLQGLKPDLGLLLSNVPETFSYTLSELFASGIPPLATRLGAFADRIEEGVTGWFVAPQADDLLERLAEIDANREALAEVRVGLLGAQQRSTSDMVADYLALLPKPSVMDARRPLCRSVVADSGVSLDQGEPSQKALFVRPGAAYRLALFQFLMYSYQKIQSSPQLTRVSRLLLGTPLRVAMRLTRPRG